MAYGLKYTTYKQIGSTRYILNIYQKDWNYEQYGSFGIGTLTGFNLQIQGDQSSMMAPIIKTSANISLKDLFDKGITQSGVTCILNGEKMGKWEEFFTRDPLKYRVDILVGNATIWSGYLTPDSWGEEMQYAGNINITARDMIGYLDEQEFDLTGRTTIQNLIQAAINKSQSSMAVSFKTTDCLYNTNGQSILASTIDASTFSGNTWYQALEKTLESLGLVLRYDGQGGFLVTSLRNQISYTYEYSTAVFTDRSGYRTLDPAVKQIVETFDPSIEPYIPADPAAESYTSNGATITQYITTEPISGGGSVQPPSHITNTFSGYTLAMPASGKGFAGQLAQPKLRTPKYGAPDRGMYLPTDVTSGQTAYYANPELKSPFILQFGLEGECLCEYGTALGPDLTPINIYKPVANDESHHSLSKIIIQVTARIGSVNYYLSADKAWEVGNSGVNIELAKDEELAVPLLDGGVDFNITIVKLETSHKNFNERTISNLVAPLLMTVSPAESHDLAGEYKTTTIYNTINRVEINRGPSIGSATCTRISLPMVKNILGYGNDIATDAWKFYGDNATFPLAVMIHAQIIVYYGQMEDSQGRETGNSIFTGNFIDSQQTPLVPATRYTYFGKTCTLLSGAYNFLTGGVDSATLREFFTWSSVWDTFNPTYSVKTSRNEGGTASAGGGGSASGGGGSTGGSVTSVDMSVPTGMTIGGNPITTRGTLALGLAAGYNFLTDTYKATLDGHLGSSSNPHNVTLEQAAGQSLADKLTALASWFEYDENNHAIRVKEYIGESQVKTSFYAYGEVTAGGIGSGGGGGSTFTAVAYANLAALTSEEMSKIPTAWAAKKLQDRIATLESTTPNVSWGTAGADYVPLNVNGTTKNLLTAHQSLSGYATTSALSAHTGDTTIHITASERSTWNGKQDALGYTPLNKAGDTMTGPLVMNTNVRLKTNGLTEIHQSDGSFGCFIHSWSSGALNLYDGTDWRTIYHSGNCNNTSTPWSASSLTLNGAISGATTGTFSTSLLAGSIKLQYTDEINRYGGTLYLQHRGHESNPTGQIAMCVNGGNVGIGTASPSYKLHVNGGDIYSSAYVRAASGFVKSGSSDSYVLLGGGGHKAEANLSVGESTALRAVSSIGNSGTANQWIKFASFDLVKRYDARYAFILVRPALSPDSDNAVGGFLNIAAYQQNAIGGAPSITFESSVYHSLWEFKMVYTYDSTGSHISIFGKCSEAWYYCSMSLISGSNIFTTTSRYDTLPSGTQKSPAYFGVSKAAYNVIGGKVSASSINVNNGGITNAGAISGATTGAFSQGVTMATSSGNVGIGTTSPSEKLHIAGSGDCYVGIDAGTSSYAQLHFKKNGVTKWQISDHAISEQLVFQYYNGSSYSDSLTILPDGKVGVGTPTPSYKLHINGSAYADSLTLNGEISGVTYLYMSGRLSDGDTYGLYVHRYHGPVYGCAAILTYDAGQTQKAFRIMASNNYGIGGLIFGCSTNDQYYGGNPSSLSYSDTICLTSGGNVGIGITNPSEKLDVAGNIVANGEITAGSDRRWKHNIESVNNGLSVLMALKPSTWNWNDDNRKGYGLIAQDVQEVIPSLVKTDNEGYLHLTYDGLHAFEISAIQSHETEIDRLKRRVKELENRIAQLS